MEPEGYSDEEAIPLRTWAERLWDSADDFFGSIGPGAAFREIPPSALLNIERERFLGREIYFNHPFVEGLAIIQLAREVDWIFGAVVDGLVQRGRISPVGQSAMLVLRHGFGAITAGLSTIYSGNNTLVLVTNSRINPREIRRYAFSHMLCAMLVELYCNYQIHYLEEWDGLSITRGTAYGIFQCLYGGILMGTALSRAGFERNDWLALPIYELFTTASLIYFYALIVGGNSWIES